MNKQWSTTEVSALKRCARLGGTWEDVAKRLYVATGRRVSGPGLRGIASRMGVVKPDRACKQVVEEIGILGPEDFEESAREELVQGLKTANAKLASELAITRVIKEDFLATVQGTLRSITPPKLTIKATNSNKSYEEVAWLHISDIHIGSKVEFGATSGITEYNFEIFKRRLEELTRSFISIVRAQRTASRKITSCILCLGGDIVDGESIFPGHPFEIDIPVFKQLTEGTHLLAQAISKISAEFEEVKIICVDGNHARPGKKGENHRLSNFDRIAYYMLSSLLKDHKNITMDVAEGHLAIVKVFEHNYLVSHGDEFKGWTGIPVYGMKRAAQNYISMTRLPIDVFIHGHHHNPASLDVGYAESILCGSFQGGSMLSVKQMQTACQPSQLCFFIHKDHKITSRWKIVLDEIPTMKADSNGFYTPMVRIENGLSK